MRETTEIPRVLSAGTIIGDRVKNAAGEELGTIDELVIDLRSGRIAYAVLSFGGFLGFGNKLFAIPWRALEMNPVERRFILDVDKDRLASAPGFDKDDWPDMADESWGAGIHRYYGLDPYWDLPPQSGAGHVSGSRKRRQVGKH